MTLSIPERVERLVRALEECNVEHVSITLKGVTPEQLVAVYPEAAARTYVHSDGVSGSYAIDSAKVPGHPEIKVGHHRAPTATELAVVKGCKESEPERSYFYGGSE